MAPVTRDELTGLLALAEHLKSSAAVNGQIEIVVRLSTAVVAIRAAVEFGRESDAPKRPTKREQDDLRRETPLKPGERMPDWF